MILKRLYLIGFLFLMMGVSACSGLKTRPVLSKEQATASQLNIATIAVPPNLGYVQELYQLGYCGPDCPDVTPKTPFGAVDSAANQLPAGLERKAVGFPPQINGASAKNNPIQTVEKMGRLKGNYTLAPVYFASNKSSLELAQATLLSYDIKALSQVPVISLSGYADHFGQESYNIKLAQARTEAVRVYLEQVLKSLNPQPKTMPRFVTGIHAVDPRTPLAVARRVEVNVVEDGGGR